MKAPITYRDIPQVMDRRVSYAPAPAGAARYSVTPSGPVASKRERTDATQTMHRVVQQVIEPSEHED